MRLDAYQRRAIFDLICWVMVLAVLVFVIGSFVGCATGVKQRDVAVAQPAAMRVRPVHAEPTIIRTGEHRCSVVAPSAISYELGGITRPIGAAFTCPTTGVAKARWGSGTRYYVVQYLDGTRTSHQEWWPE